MAGAIGSRTGGSGPGINMPGSAGAINTGGAFGGRFSMPGTQTGLIPNLPIDSTGQADPSSMNGMARDPAVTQFPVAARDSAIPILYGGPERIAGLIYTADISSSNLYLTQLLCLGEVDHIGTNLTNDFSGVYVNDAAAPAGMSIHKYRGDPAQASGSPDSWISAIYTSPAFDEVMPGVAYIVTETTPAALTRFPRVVADVKGLKVYDPRSNLLPYSNTFSSWPTLSNLTAAQNADGPHGARLYAWTITDTSGSATGFLTEAITVPNNSAQYAVHLKVAKSAAPILGINLSLAGGAAVNSILRFDPNSGAFSGGANTTVVALSATWWQVTFTITNNSSGNTALGVAIYAAANAAGTTMSPYPGDNNATTGSNVIAECQIRSTVNPVGYVETAASGQDQVTQWTDNPALCLADFLSNSTYGEGRTVGWWSVAAAAEYCDQMVSVVIDATYTWSGGTVTIKPNTGLHTLGTGNTVYVTFTSGGLNGTSGSYYVGTLVNPYVSFPISIAGSGASGNCTYSSPQQNERRSKMTLLIDRVNPVRAWRDVMRAYVPCWVNIDNGVAFLRVDGPDSSIDFTFTNANISASESLPVLRRNGIQDIPTTIIIGYTDAKVTPFTTKTAEATTGASPERITRIDLPGIRSDSQARRFAIERLNHYQLEDTIIEFTAFDEALKVFPGDKINATDDLWGGTAIECRVLAVTDLGFGRWRIKARKYDSRVFSGSVTLPP